MRLLVFLLFLIAHVGLKAQSSSSFGILPKVVVSHRWADNTWRLTGQVESMQRLWNQPAAEPSTFDYLYIRTDFTFVLSYRLNPGLNLAFGQMTRISFNEVIYRSLQQVSFTSGSGSIRFGHRIRTDQTFVSGRDARHRLRYRFSAELPLKGQSLNDKEWYLKPGVEQLLIVESGKFSWEQRLMASLGYYFNSGNKLELGLDYRLDDFTDAPGRHRLWQTITYYLNL